MGHATVLETLFAMTYVSMALSVYLLYRSYRRYRRALLFRDTLRASNKNGVLRIAANGRVRRAAYSIAVAVFIIAVFIAFSLAIPSGPRVPQSGGSPAPSGGPGSGNGPSASFVPGSGAGPGSGGGPGPTVVGSGNGGLGSGNGVYGFILIGGLIGTLVLVTLSGIGDDQDTVKMLRYKDEGDDE